MKWNSLLNDLIDNDNWNIYYKVCFWTIKKIHFYGFNTEYYLEYWELEAISARSKLLTQICVAYVEVKVRQLFIYSPSVQT